MNAPDTTPGGESDRLLFVAGVNDVATFTQRLWSSPCLRSGRWPLVAHFHAGSAAEAFNAVADSASHRAQADWLVWVHQDVVLPQGWDDTFRAALAASRRRWPQVAVAGLYGVQGAGAQAHRLGHLLDRGRTLREPAALPALADSLDELLVAVRMDAGLRFEPALGYDFYGTDIVLQAQARGLQAVVVDAYCEHWSGTPQFPPFPARLVARVGASASAFERKWQDALPVSTPCFDIARVGDVERFLALAEGREPAP